MAKQLVPDVAGARVVQDFLGAEIINTLYVRDITLPWTQAKLNALAVRVRDTWVLRMLPLQAVALTLVRVDTEDLGADPGLNGTSASGAVGTLLGEPISAALAVNVAFVGDAGALPRRGRNFFSGLTEGVINGDTVAAAHAVAVRDAYNQLVADIALVPSQAMVIVSRSFQTPAQTADIAAKRAALKTAIAAARRATGVSNTLDVISTGVVVATQRDRRS